MVTTIESKEEFEQQVLNQKGFVLVDFFASWCRPCKMMALVMDRTAEEMKNELRFCKVDTEALEELAKGFRLLGVPTFILFKDGKEAGRIIGYHQRDAFIVSVRQAMEQAG